MDWLAEQMERNRTFAAIGVIIGFIASIWVYGHFFNGTNLMVYAIVATIIIIGPIYIFFRLFGWLMAWFLGFLISASIVAGILWFIIAYITGYEPLQEWMSNVNLP
jgi:hypothetical protein